MILLKKEKDLKKWKYLGHRPGKKMRLFSQVSYFIGHIMETHSLWIRKLGTMHEQIKHYCISFLFVST